jgi:hypothetical protein
MAQLLVTSLLRTSKPRENIEHLLIEIQGKDAGNNAHHYWYNQLSTWQQQQKISWDAVYHKFACDRTNLHSQCFHENK